MHNLSPHTYNQPTTNALSPPLELPPLPLPPRHHSLPPPLILLLPLTLFIYSLYIRYPPHALPRTHTAYSYCIPILHTYCTHTAHSYCILILHTHTAQPYCTLILHTPTVPTNHTTTRYSSPTLFAMAGRLWRWTCLRPHYLILVATLRLECHSCAAGTSRD
jgi:hypothetical protein